MEKRKLIDARGLYKKLFTCPDGSICPDTDCDNFPITLTVKSIKKAITEEPTITEQEIINPYLDKIRAEITGKYRIVLKDTPKDDWSISWNECIDEVLEVIEKYKAEMEVENVY